MKYLKCSLFMVLALLTAGFMTAALNIHNVGAIGPPSLFLYEPIVDNLTVTVPGVVFPGSAGASVYELRWDWGDGRIEDSWFSATHTYSEYGNFTIAVTAYQNDGFNTTATTAVFFSSQISIDSDGSVNPPSSPITTVDNFTYTFGSSMNHKEIVVWRDNMVLDGSGFFLQGAITSNSAGITLAFRTNVTIKNIEIRNFGRGIYMVASSNCCLIGNSIMGNTYGMSLTQSKDNRISENNIESNQIGISLGTSFNNSIYHNNFLGNLRSSAESHDDLENAWDNGAEGNFWGFAYGMDPDGDGIGDVPYTIYSNNQDKHPLMEIWNQMRVIDISWGGTMFPVLIESNSTIAHLSFDQANKEVNFKTTGPNGTIGFYDVAIPRELLDSFPYNNWTLLADGESIIPNIAENATHTLFNFTVQHSTKLIRIIGTNPIDNNPPLAVAGENQTIYENTILVFDGAASRDDVEISNYTWTFLDKTIITLTGPSPNYKFKTPGTYVVTLNVTDLRNHWSVANITLTVLAVPLWYNWWFWGVVVVLPAVLFGCSGVWFHKLREGIYDKLQKLVRQQANGNITEPLFEKKVKQLEERSDDNTKSMIKELLPHLIAYEQGRRVIEQQEDAGNK